MKVRESWGEGNPLAGAPGVPFPPSPPSFPNALFSGGWSGAKTLPLFPRQPSPGNAKKKTSRSLAKRQQRIEQQKPAGMAGFLVCTAKQTAEKICLLPIYAEPTESKRQALPHSPLRRKQAHTAKEGTTRLPILRLRVRAKRAAATEKEPATPHESEAAQRPERGRTPSGHVRHRKTHPLNASHEPFLEHFQFEMLCISNHTACRFAERFAEKARFFRSLLAGRRCAAASRFTFFKVETL